MGLLIAVPVLAGIDLLVESIFGVGVMVFLLSYLIPLLRELENPFAYCVAHSAASVSLRPFEDCIARPTARGEAGSGRGRAATSRRRRSASLVAGACRRSLRSLRSGDIVGRQRKLCQFPSSPCGHARSAGGSR